MARKVLAIICLVIAGLVVLTGLTVLGMLTFVEDMAARHGASSRSAAMGVHVLGATGGCITLAGVGLIFAGAALWGMKRARMVFGITLTSVGGYLLVMAFIFYTLRMDPNARNMPEQAFFMLDSLAGPSVLFGLIILAVGVPLILYQRRLDRRSSAPPPLPPAALENTPPGR